MLARLAFSVAVSTAGLYVLAMLIIAIARNGPSLGVLSFLAIIVGLGTLVLGSALEPGRDATDQMAGSCLVPVCRPQVVATQPAIRAGR